MSDRMTKEEHANVLAALETCKTGGYRDIDGDWCKRQVFDEPAVAEAITIMRKEPEPNSDAEFLELWSRTTCDDFTDSIIAFGRALLEKAR